MKKQIKALSFIAISILFASCGGNSKNGESVNILTAGLNMENIDTATKPTADFFQFVNGNWLKNNPIPASESRWGSFNELYEKNTAKLKLILEEAVADKSAKAGSNTQKIGDFYSLAMD